MRESFCPDANAGIPAFAVSWTLANAASSGVGAAAKAPQAAGFGRPGPVTGTAGSLAYYEVLSRLHEVGMRLSCQKVCSFYYLNFLLDNFLSGLVLGWHAVALGLWLQQYHCIRRYHHSS